MEFFHTLNRGVDKRKIFMDDQDRYRFIHDLFEFNDQNKPVSNRRRRSSKMVNFASRPVERKLLVAVHAFCLMESHYHLLLSPLVEDGVVKFMRKLNIGYSKYFNSKYKRTGALFEGRYKSVPVTTDAHFIHLPYYIHFNPLDFEFHEWREGKLKDYDKAIKFLESYKWSSHLDYLGKNNLPSITQRDELIRFFNENGGYEENISRWLKDLDTQNNEELFLE
jgi:putative transposase